MIRVIAACLCLLLAGNRLLAETIRVSAAISLKEALLQIARQYQARTGDHVEYNLGASGELLVQIQQGAKVDVFISAANQQVQQLKREGLLADSPMRIIARNSLVLIVPAGARYAPGSFAELADPRVRHIAIGQPNTVPAGQYAMQALRSMKLADALQERLVFGGNVRQVLDYVAAGEVEAGIVYRTDAQTAGQQVRVVEVADPEAHEPIEYPAAVIKASPRQAAAERFVQYLVSEEGQKALAAQGFIPGGQQPTTQTGSTR